MRGALVFLLVFAASATAGELFNPRIAVLDEFPRELRRGESLRLTGMRKGNWESPELIVIAPNGRTSVCRKRTIEEYRFTFEPEFDEGTGPYRFELYLRSPNRGGVSAARFTVWYGKRKPAVEKEEPPPTGPPTPVELHPRLMEKRFLATLNEFRKSLKLDPVGWNEAVAARARDHASKMARAKRRVHKFGGRSVLELLREGGAGEWAPWSGPPSIWGNVVDYRPFPRPALQPPGPRVLNHVVQFVSADVSLPVLFETYYVREAAHRLLAADPFCLEVGIGCAREVGGDPRKLYYCVCFVQVNEKPVHDGQEIAFRKLKDQARSSMDPELIRRLAFWSREAASAPVVKSALKSDDEAVRGSAWDAWLLLDEEKARKEIAEALAEATRRHEARDYGKAYALVAGLSEVTYDERIAVEAMKAEKLTLQAALEELEGVAKLPQDRRESARRDLERRLKGVPVEVPPDGSD